MELFEKITRIAVKLYSGCNMKCCYCFQPYNDKIKPRIFSDYDNLYKFVKSLPLSDIVIVTLVGGEVTLRPDLVKLCIKKVFKRIEREQDVTFHCATISNGTNLDILLDLCNENYFYSKHCCISWDGLFSSSLSRKINGKYDDEYFKNMILQLGKSEYNDKISIVHALTPETLPYLADSFKFCFDNNVLSLGYYYIHEANYNSDYIYKEFEKQIRKICDMYIQNDKINFYNWVNYFQRRRNPDNFFTCVKLGNNYFINPEGEIYPCIYLGDHKAYNLGNIKDGIDLNKQNEFVKEYYHYPLCKYKTCKCYQCSECPAANYVNNGSLHKRFEGACELYKIENKVFEEYYETIKDNIMFNNEYLNEMLPTYDLNKFTECDFESHYSESKSPNLNIVQQWNK